MKVYQFDSFVNSLDSKTESVKVLDLKHKGFNLLEGNQYIVAVVQTLKPMYRFANIGTNKRIIELSINSSYCDDSTIPYLEKVFINAYFRKYILDNFM